MVEAGNNQMEGKKQSNTAQQEANTSKGAGRKVQKQVPVMFLLL